MYKIYINETPLYLVTGPSSLFSEEIGQVGSNHLVLRYNGKKKFLLNVIDQLEKSQRIESAVLYYPDVEAIFITLKNVYEIIEAAGGLVFNSEGQVLIIYRRGKWDLPKGKLDDGESTRAAAIREVSEETGLKKLSIVKPLPDTYHTYNLRGKRILKKTYWYEMLTPDISLHLQHEEDIEEGRWVSKSQIISGDFDFYRSILDVLNAVFQFKRAQN